MSEEKKSPLEFNHIPHRNGLFVHFDANTQTYLVQAFFKPSSSPMTSPISAANS